MDAEDYVKELQYDNMTPQKWALEELNSLMESLQEDEQTKLTKNDIIFIEYLLACNDWQQVYEIAKNYII